MGAGAEHWVSTFEYAHKDVYLLLAVELRLAAKQRQCDRMLRRAPIHVAILAGLQPVASDARLAHAHFVPGPGPAAVTSHLSGAHDAHSLLGYIIDREHYRHLGSVVEDDWPARREPAERSLIPVYLRSSKFRRENAFRRASARKGKSARVLLRCSFTVGSRTGPLWAHLGPISLFSYTYETVVLLRYGYSCNLCDLSTLRLKLTCLAADAACDSPRTAAHPHEDAQRAFLIWEDGTSN